MTNTGSDNELAGDASDDDGENEANVWRGLMMCFDDATKSTLEEDYNNPTWVQRRFGSFAFVMCGVSQCEVHAAMAI